MIKNRTKATEPSIGRFFHTGDTDATYFNVLKFRNGAYVIIAHPINYVLPENILDDEPMNHINSFWKNVLNISKHGEVEKAMHLVLKELKPKLLEKHYDYCNELLNALDLKTTSLDILTIILNITKPWREKILNRQSIIDEALNKAKLIYNDSDAHRLIDPKI